MSLVDDGDPRLKVARHSLDVLLTKLVVEVPRLGVGIDPRIRRHVLGGYADVPPLG